MEENHKEPIFCNVCGCMFDEWDEQAGLSIHKRLTYGSKYDDSMLSLKICCKCADKIIDRCVITPVSGVWSA